MKLVAFEASGFVMRIKFIELSIEAKLLLIWRADIGDLLSTVVATQATTAAEIDGGLSAG